MGNTTTLNETLRSPIDGTEYIRLATPGANWKAKLSSIARVKLTANTTYYVRTTGSDSNGGTDPTTDAFATLQHAWDFLAGSLDLGQFTLKIDVGAGTFNLLTANTWVGGSAVNIVGAGSSSTTLTDVAFITSGASAAGGAIIGPEISIDGVHLLGSASPPIAANPHVFQTLMPGTVTLGYLTNDTTVEADGTGVSDVYFYAFGGGVTLGLNIKSYKGSPNTYGLWADTLCNIFNELSFTGTLIGSPTCGVAFAEANTNGTIISLNYGYTGAVGGANFAHFYVNLDGDIDVFLPNTFGADFVGTFFPGNPGGAVPIGYIEAGGQYRNITDLFPRTFAKYISPGDGIVGPVAPVPGARGFLTDANSTTFGSIVAGGGANFVPMYADGTNWRIG